MSYFREPNREQLKFQTIDLEKLIPEDHPVRFFWKVCEKLDLSALYNEYKITEESEGRPAYDPRLMLCLFLYGYSQGIYSTRELAEACKYRADFMWLCGGIQPEYRILAYFRTRHTEALEEAFCKMTLALKKAGLIKMEIFFQDGTKIRADASPSSFKKKDKLEKEWGEAKRCYEAFINYKEKEVEEKRKRIEENKIKKKIENIEKAIKKVEEITKRRKGLSRKDKEKYPPKEAKGSVTDPDAQFMKFRDGGKKPGYNAQICIERETEIIVGKRVSSEPTDTKEMIPMIKEVKKNIGVEEIGGYVTDGGYYRDENIEVAKEEGVKEIIMPIHVESKYEGAREVKEVGGSERGKELMKERFNKVERVIGYIKEKGLKFRRFHLRGIEKVNCEWTIVCMAYNILRIMRLGRREEYAKYIRLRYIIE